MFTLTGEELVAIKLSLRVALVATALSLPVGVLIALVLARGRFLGRGLLNALVLVPLVLPPVVIGFGRVIHVDAEVIGGAHTGDDWPNAFKHLSDALVAFFGMRTRYLQAVFDLHVARSALTRAIGSADL